MFEGVDKDGKPVGPKKITEMYAWVATESDGGEGIPAFFSQDTWMPMIGADKDRIGELRNLAIQATNDMPLKLIRLHNVEVLEVIRP